MRRMQSGSGQSGIFGFNKSKARIVSPNSPKITFENVALWILMKQRLNWKR